MVDFSKRLGKRELQKPVDPIAIYDNLDRASDKGELRRVQAEILRDWYKSFREKKDVILKLHTGQGKTLIGLLILQSKLNEGKGPAVFLCPNNYLVEQTMTQAKQFGVQCCSADGELPDDFLNSKAILVTSVQKMFNGRTKFNLGSRSVDVGCLVMDDCHACIDSIQDAYTLRFSSEDDAYKSALALFSSSLENQGAGSYADIQAGDPNSLLPVPYWDWQGKASEVVSRLSERVNEEAQKGTGDARGRVSRHECWFVWPLLKDMIQDCFCVISGSGLEITPYLAPLEQFGSFFHAKHRIFMSATITDDSFLIKGLRLSAETVLTPLIYKNERWSGEKMIGSSTFVMGKTFRIS